jgi:hypothetical protein
MPWDHSLLNNPDIEKTGTLQKPQLAMSSINCYWLEIQKLSNTTPNGKPWTGLAQYERLDWKTHHASIQYSSLNQSEIQTICPTQCKRRNTLPPRLFAVAFRNLIEFRVPFVTNKA